MITLYGSVQTAPDAEVVELDGSGETYEEALAALDERVPQGGRLLGISRWPCA